MSTPARDRSPNRLGAQNSPYLLQHALNPVDWYPWGEEAFEAARARDVPIFLSIGYSTCYWCHVMERESFENDQIAAMMNRDFVCVKVDREERPDVDDLYMAATQAFNHGQGGWPMSVFLEPKTLRPFFAGTYFPSEPGYSGRATFPQVLGGLASAWHERRDEVVEQSRSLAEAAAERVGEAHAPVRLGVEHVVEGVGTLLRIHDRVLGGFGSAPKFPQPVYLDLLAEFLPLSGDDATRGAVESALRTTLDRMAIGGIFDQAGGGFHRYSVDEKWLVPHFEKMLYDNALLASVYARAAERFGDGLYARTCARVCDYVIHEMASPEGGFLSAQDAEVNHREGQNYLWTPGQFRDAMSSCGVSEGDCAIGMRAYKLDMLPPGAGNFRDPHHPDDGWTNVLELADRPDRLARAMGLDETDLLEALDRVNDALLRARAQRDQPGTDDKVLAGWNGLMIAGLSDAARVLGERRYLDAAATSASFVLREMYEPTTGELRRSWRAGSAHIPAFLDDYAYLAQGLCALAKSSRSLGAAGPLAGSLSDDDAVGHARALVERAHELFGDRPGDVGGADFGAGGVVFYDARAGQADLFVRPRTVYDGATPSGVGVLINTMLDLDELCGRDAGWARRAAMALRGVSGFVGRAPVGATNSLRALTRMIANRRAELADAMDGLDVPGETGELGVGASAERADAPVQVFASADRVSVTRDEPGGVLLRVVIADGYHVLANGPSGAGRDAGNLVPTTVAVVNGSGVKGYAQYPSGEPYDDGKLLVYRGVVEIPVVLAREGARAGRPLLSVTYQACRDDACELPRTLELGVAIDVLD